MNHELRLLLSIFVPAISLLLLLIFTLIVTKQKNKIICLVGESGSGKTTIAKALHDKDYNVIQSYTTRKRRSPDEFGHTHVSDASDMYKSFKNKKLISNTCYGGEYYWATESQFKGNKESVYVIDPRGVQALQNIRNTEIIIVYIKTEYAKRWERILNSLSEAEKNFVSPKAVRKFVDERANREIDQYKVFKTHFVVDNNGGLEDAVVAVENIIKYAKKKI